ncbi:ABC transporter substrate-binding protein [Marispirochaeta aestuarii]|uniref:ABC transporter substrate-binding protein n=1 Tax=Marispirochaeta aestuarii TaxID=1963862 RepID=UPI0029C6B859|nr:ABC transporter substrate-binding protein [Marispirochaeta aestuarii]
MVKKASIIIFIFLALFFAGCSKDDGNNNTTDKTNDIETSTSSGKQISLRWFNFQRELTDLTADLADAYMEENPNVTIEVEMIGDGYFDVIKARAASGDLPDIFNTRGYKGMEMYSAYMQDLSDEPFVDKMVEDIKLGLTLDGKILGVPYQLSGWGIIYNKEIFKENGIVIPTTFTELKQVCNTLKAKGVTPFINQFKDSWMLGHLSGTGIANIDKPMDFISEVEDGNASFVNSPEMKYHLEFFDFILDNGQKNPLDDDWNSACSKMGLGEGAMMLEGIWVYDTIAAVNPEIKLGMFAVPYTDNQEETTIYADFNGLWHVSKTTEYTEEAKMFLNWLVDSTTSKTIIREAALLPAYKGYKADTHSVGIDIMGYIEEEKTKPFGWLLVPDAYESEAGKAYQSYILEKTSHDELLKTLTELVQDLTMN